MKYLAFISLIIIITSCGQTDQNTKNLAVDSSTVSSATTTSNIVIDDPSLYPKAFLDSLKSTKYKEYTESLHLGKNYLIIGSDTIYFQDDLKEKESYIFDAQKDSIKYQLTVKKINLTDVDFKYTVSQNDRVLYTEKGVSRLLPLFFLGIETPTDNLSGDGYEAYEYFNIKNSAMSSINIGVGYDDNNLLRACVKGNNEKLFPDITLRSR